MNIDAHPRSRLIVALDFDSLAPALRFAEQIADLVGMFKIGCQLFTAEGPGILSKLSPLVTDIGLIARAAEQAGADALTVANTYPAMALNYRTGRSRIGNPTGGLSGPAIKPITLRLAWECRRAVRVPIIGLGGIETVEDVLDYLSVGATIVQVGTASFADPRASERLVGGLERLIRHSKYSSLNEIVQEFSTEDS